MNKMIVVAMTALLFVGLTSGLLPGTAGHAQAAPGKVFQSANMLEFGTTNNVDGGGTLTRSKNQVWVRLATSGLDLDAAYTVWWIIFNNPEECAGDPCAGGDLEDPDVEGSVVYAAGFVTGGDGIANVTAHLDHGNPPSGTDVLRGDGLNNGNGLGAEIHLVVRSHEGLITGSVGAQISSVGGGCGVNICEDQQAILFLPAE